MNSFSDSGEEHPVFAVWQNGRAFELSDIVPMHGMTQIENEVESSAIEFLCPRDPNVSLTVARDALFAIDADCEYPAWLRCASALKHQFSPDEEEEAYELFDEWSRGGIKYGGERETRAKWDSLRQSPEGRAPATIGSLLKMASEATAAKETICARSLGGLTRPEDDPKNELLKDRFLCRAGGALLVGPTGVGKSVLVMQCLVSWAIGREAFGIRPAGLLKSLLIQAENDDGDLVEMRDGVFQGLGLSDEERSKAGEMIYIRQETAKTSFEFFQKVATPLLETHRPDLLIIDPALAYLGGDSNSQKDVGTFLRNCLNPLLQKYQCGALVVHHTNKPPRGVEKEGYAAGDFAYLGGGSAEWANWPRCVLALQSVGSHTVFKLRAGKRGARLGWRNDDGSKRFEHLIGHSQSAGIYWRDATEAEAVEAQARKPGAPVQHTSQEVLRLLRESDKPLKAGEWKRRCVQELGISPRTFDTRKAELQKSGQVSVDNGLWKSEPF